MTGKRGIEAAALPYSIIDARTGREVDKAAFWDKVDASRLVCVGEDHSNPHHHWVQLEVMKEVVAHKKHTLALGMEMFQRPFQGLLDDYAASRIDEATLLSRSAWEERWGFDYGFYGPTIRAAIAAHAALLALNASKELVPDVVQKGLEGLTPEEKAQVPELDLGNKAHRAWFDATMEEMGGATAHQHEKKDGDEKAVSEAPPATPKMQMPSADRIYTAQVLWDETMADTAAKWLAATPNSSVVVLAGNGHCHDTAIVGRAKRRGVTESISVRPVLDVEGHVAEALAKPMNDFLVVLKLPPGASD
jgi:uncharacterized iron-regulated protein